MKPLMKITGESQIDRLVEAAVYQDGYVFLIITPMGIWSASLIDKDMFAGDMTTASRDVWRTTWQKLREIEQRHELVSEHPQGTEFDP